MDNLSEAFRKARKGKRRRPDVAQFGLDLEQELCILQGELAAGEYMPGAYRQFTVYERKPRLISVAPFRDRVVHHAVMNVLEPLLDKHIRNKQWPTDTIFYPVFQPTDEGQS